MPFVLINRIVVDTLRGAEGLSAVGTPHEHHVGSVGSAGWLHARHDVNIVIRAGARTVHRQEKHPSQSGRIYVAGEIKIAAKVDRSALVERRGDGAVSGIARANAPDLARVYVYPADKENPVRIDVGGSPLGRVGNEDWIHPGHAAIGGTAELPAAVIIPRGAPRLVLESVTRAVRVIYRKPLLVASRRGSKIGPSLTAVERAPHVVKKCLQKAEIIKTSRVIGGQNWVAAEDVVLENAGERPGRAAVAGISKTALPEIGSNAVELPPTDYFPAAVCWVYGDRRLVRGIAGDIHAARIDVNLKTYKQVLRHDHSRRNPYSPQGGWGWRVVVFFEWLGWKSLGLLGLGRGDGKKREKNQTSDGHQGRPRYEKAKFFHTVK